MRLFYTIKYIYAIINNCEHFFLQLETLLKQAAYPVYRGAGL